MQRTSIILAFFFFYINSLSQSAGSGGLYPFVHYTPREGLANNRARSVFQDSRGKLYISTYGGLSVYDGSRFTNYSTNNGLASRLVNQVVEMGEDSLWVVLNTKKIHCLVNGKLKDLATADNYTPIVNQLIKCGDGKYYALADEGVFRLENKKFTKLPLRGIPGSDTMYGLYQGVEIDKKLFVLTNPDYRLVTGNLLVYDLVREKLLAYYNDINAYYLFRSPRNELWVATIHGVFLMDHKFIGKAPRLNRLADSLHLPENIPTTFIYQDRQQNTWLNTHKGVYCISKDGKASLLTTENGLTTNIQNSIFQDIENNMWFTNERSGVSKLSTQQLVYYPVFRDGYSITEAYIHPSSDSVWLHDGHHDKILLLDPDGRSHEYIYKDSALFPARFVSANGEFLLSGNKIYRCKNSGQDRQYHLSVSYQDTSSILGFTSGAREKNGNLVAIYGKLVLLAGDKVMSAPIDGMADQLTIDNNNRVWIATRSNQLYCFEISGTGTQIRLSLLRKFDNLVPNIGPRSIASDKSGNIWIGTRDHGLYCLFFDDLKLSQVRQFTTLDGMSENFINYLFCDKDNHIWACTPSGLDRIIKNREQFLIENITKSSNIFFPIYKIQQAKNGLLWIISDDGMITYKPEMTVTSTWKPLLAVSNVLINNSNKISLLSGGELKYSQNNLAFHLAAPTFIDEKQTRFSYLLEGSGNENWSLPSADASVNFANLRPGEYKLRAKANFLHGRYPEIESTYSFTILPPWWLTWWFKALAAVVIVALVILGLRSYVNRKLVLQRVMLEKKQAIEKERTRIATDMHDDLGAGLSQIKFLSEAIGIKRQKQLPIEEEVGSIRDFSDEMIDKMGEIVWALNEKNDTLSDLLSYTRSYAVEYLAQNGIRCTVEEPDNIPQDYVSGEFRRNIYLTVKEALHNIVKHAQATDVQVKIEINSRLNIQLADNGIGINNSSQSRSGNGLISMKNRVNELKGTFDIENRDGAVINIRVPLNQ